MDGYRRVSSRIRGRSVSEHMYNQTRAASQRESGLFADMILHATQAANSIRPDTASRVSRYRLVPNILLIAENTGNTYYQSAMAFGRQTNAGGKAISARSSRTSLLATSNVRWSTRIVFSPPQSFGSFVKLSIRSRSTERSRSRGKAAVATSYFVSRRRDRLDLVQGQEPAGSSPATGSSSCLGGPRWWGICPWS